MITGVILGTAALGLIVSLFGDRYECSPEEVQAACEELGNISNNTLQAISDEIGKEVKMVNNAASGLLDISNMNEYAPAVQDSITNLISVLDKQAEMIEEYNNGNLVEKMLGTGTMAILNLTEGIARFGEDIVDAGANIIAGFGSIFGADTESIELWAAKDHVGNWFDDAFENGAFNWVEKYSIYSHESTAAEIFKGIGTAIPYIALAATGVGLAAEATVAGAAGFGRGSTNYQQQHLEYDANGVASFDDTYTTGRMMWEGTKQGVVDAALTVGMDKGFKAIGNGISKLKAGKTLAESADDAGRALINSADDAGRAVVNSADDAGRAVVNSADDAGRAVINSADDAGRAVVNSADDAGRAVINSADDAGRAVVNSTDDVGRTVVNGADDAMEATVKGSDSATLSQAKQDLLKRYKSGEITRDEMIQGIQKSAGNAPAKAVANSADDAGRALINSADDAGRAVANSTDDVGRTVVNGADDAMEATVKGSDSATLSQAKQDLLKRYKSGEITRDEMIQGIQKSAGNAPAEAVANSADDAGRALINSADDAGRTVVNGASETGENAFSRYAKKMSEGEKLKYDKFINGADDTGKAALKNVDGTARTVINGSDDTGKALINSTDNVANATTNAVRKIDNELAEELSRIDKAVSEGKMTPAQGCAAKLDAIRSGKVTSAERDALVKNVRQEFKKVHPDILAGQARKAATETAEQTARKAATETAEQTARKVATETAEQTARKVATETAEQTARKAATETAEQTARKAATGTAEQTARKAATGAAEQTARKADVVADVGEQAASKAAQSGSKWHSPLEATTPRAKVTRAYDTAVENMKNAASDVKSKIKGAFDDMKPSGSTASAGPRIGDNSIPARVTQAYDNAVEGIKNVGAKAGTAAKKVATDTATFVKENPKRAVIGGGLLSTEKAIGNIKTSYIPNNYASAEVQELSKIGGGENRIVIDEVDDLIAQADANTPTTPEPTQPSQTYTGGTSTGGGTYTAPTTPSSNTSPGTSTTPSEKPSDGNTTTSGVNDNTNNNNDNKSDDTNKTPDNTTPTTPEPTPSDNGSTVISNPPSNNNQGSSGVNHGGTTNNNTGNSSTGNNNWSSNTTESGIEENPELEPELPIEDSDLIDEPGEEESVYTIPSNLSGVKETKKSNSGSGILPVLGGLGAAAAVGVGAKMYLDNKKNNENGDDDEEYSEGDDENFNTSENDDLLADEWNGEDTEFNYEDSSGDNNVETDDDDLGEM